MTGVRPPRSRSTSKVFVTLALATSAFIACGEDGDDPSGQSTPANSASVPPGSLSATTTPSASTMATEMANGPEPTPSAIREPADMITGSAPPPDAPPSPPSREGDVNPGPTEPVTPPTVPNLGPPANAANNPPDTGESDVPAEPPAEPSTEPADPEPPVSDEPPDAGPLRPDAGSPDDLQPPEEEPTDDDCPHSGNVSYQFNDLGAWPEDALEKIMPALDEALYYYNCYSDLSHSLTINYKPSVQTAEANVDGWISFGQDRNYMVTATVMHEIGHTMGVGYYPWGELLEDGRWTGQHVNELMASIPAEERDSGYGERDYITADSLHFWPYGLNYASEHESEWSLINHVRIVAAMNRDKTDFMAR